MLVRGAKIARKCKSCGAEFEARVADVKRGWGLYCSKSCKAIKQEGKTGQYAKLLSRPTRCKINYNYSTRIMLKSHLGRMLLAKQMTVCDGDEFSEFDEDYGDADLMFDPSWDAHKEDY